MSRRPPSTPPHIEGFDPISTIGAGGFADVFLYQQRHPSRQVAVKVLLKSKMAASTVASFTAEANTMAQFSSHPSIVGIYQAGISDDGRPYLAMEYCPRPNLQVRHRKERFSEAETLRVGVQIAAAVETAHRAGVLHRDIKPANILVDRYGHPKLADFGIAAAGDGSAEMVGMSIPWSPPESLSIPIVGSRASDVYSLAATLYTLLTNRSPFQIPGASNTDIDVISRIQAMPVPPIGRADVSESLEVVLRQAMSKNPADRPQTAQAFAHALQKVQIEHGMQPTPIVLDDEDLSFDTDDEDGEEETRFRGIMRIDAQPTATVPAAPNAPTTLNAPTGPNASTAPTVPTVLTGPTVPTAPAEDTVRSSGGRSSSAPQPAFAPARVSAPAVPPIDDTVVRTPMPDAPVEVDVPQPRRRRGLVIGILSGVVLIAAVVTIVIITSLSGSTTSPVHKKPTSAPVDIDGAQPAEVEDVSGIVRDGEAVFTWSNPDPQKGDRYLWRPVVAGESFSFEPATEPTASLPPVDEGRTCIEVLLVRADGSAATEGVQGCTS
ncbi:serine/threonine-protein kinase [Microbacterium suwonense]|uniref:non-specific serine/threonine protein kinase n=1 Tax=Microbacterium suwonense TaxID=683047 RepID=A0ABM8FVG7_9MICO|nr:serine/threonine protein kinase [Microbacterium suwonense]BDZ39632.1 hypothetical protein GCM10025863_22460 [Microbacterium suwonense]